MILRHPSEYEAFVVEVNGLNVLTVGADVPEASAAAVEWVTTEYRLTRDGQDAWEAWDKEKLAPIVHWAVPLRVMVKLDSYSGLGEIDGVYLTPGQLKHPLAPAIVILHDEPAPWHDKTVVKRKKRKAKKTAPKTKKVTPKRVRSPEAIAKWRVTMEKNNRLKVSEAKLALAAAAAVQG